MAKRKPAGFKEIPVPGRNDLRPQQRSPYPRDSGREYLRYAQDYNAVMDFGSPTVSAEETTLGGAKGVSRGPDNGQRTQSPSSANHTPGWVTIRPGTHEEHMISMQPGMKRHA